jgi:hypothetical protein
VRILFDTNVLFAAFTVHGFCEELLEETVDLCTIVWSAPLRDELVRALRRKRLFSRTVSDAITALPIYATCAFWRRSRNAFAAIQMMMLSSELRSLAVQTSL